MNIEIDELVVDGGDAGLLDQLWDSLDPATAAAITRAIVDAQGGAGPEDPGSSR